MIQRVISKDELAYGAAFAGERAATTAEYCKDWSVQLSHNWTTADCFRHIAAGALNGVTPEKAGGLLAMLKNADQMSAVPRADIAVRNDKSIERIADWDRGQIIQAIRDLGRARAEFVATIDEEQLLPVVKLGDYEMPTGEILAQIWIHHTISHAYEASARWPWP